MKSTALLAFLFLLVMSAGLAAAEAVIAPRMPSPDAPDYDILSVEVNDLLAFSRGSAITVPNLDVERGDTLEIEVVLQGNNSIAGSQVPDVRVEAKIIGYEFGTISAISDIFSVDQGLVYKKKLTLVIPEDIDA